jgi:signal transduction histidine kinase
MSRIWGTLAFRFALSYWLLVIASMAVIGIAVYIGGIAVLQERVDSSLISLSHRLTTTYDARGGEAVKAEIDDLLSDNIDQDTEDYLLISPAGVKVAGNITPVPEAKAPFDQFTDHKLARYDQPSFSRILPHRLPDGAILVVGRDMRDLMQIRRLVLTALGIGVLVSCVISAVGAMLFRRRLESSVAVIRRTAGEIVAGDLTRRIPIFGPEDEFVRLNRDINHMLDRIEQLVRNVKDVSNAIAHDLRTPLGRIRAQLDVALRPGTGKDQLTEAARQAIDNVDSTITTLDRMLQISEAEAGAGRRFFDTVDLGTVVTDVVELYDAAAESAGISLVAEDSSGASVFGDKNLLASAIANLVDNSLKYAGHGAAVRVGVVPDGGSVSIVVRDNGPGIASEERGKAVQRFYRLDRSRSMPGNGLGLSIVAAIAELHWGKLILEEGKPGLVARVVLPRSEEYRIAAN